MAYVVAGKTGKAIQEFTTLSRHPQDVEAQVMGLMGRVECLVDLEDLDQALSDANAAVAALPDENTYEQRARVHHLRGDDERCLADLGRAIKLSPGDPGPLNARADKYESLGRTEEADADRAASVAASAAARAPVAAPPAPTHDIALSTASTVLLGHGTPTAHAPDVASATSAAPRPGQGDGGNDLSKILLFGLMLLGAFMTILGLATSLGGLAITGFFLVFGGIIGWIVTKSNSD